MRAFLLAGLASVATLIAGGAPAADLPSAKSAPADFVRICDSQGVGFFLIPGTDTCLKAGGLARAEYAWVKADNIVAAPSYKYAGGAPVATFANSLFVPAGTLDQTGFHARLRVELDARTPTSFGVARSFISIRGAISTGTFGGADNYLTNAFTGQTGAASTVVENAIVQFAGFTFGRTLSELFTFVPAIQYNSIATASFPAGVNLLSYTANLGGGLSASIGIEDRGGMNFSTTPTYIPIGPGGSVAPAATFPGATAGAGGGAIANGPYGLPAGAANIRYDASWGSVQAMGSIVQNVALTSFANPLNNGVIRNTGWALGAGLKLNLPMLAAGDVLYVAAAYANGDIDELNGNNTSGHIANMAKEFNGLMRVDRNMYVTPVAAMAGACALAATVTARCFASEQTTGWSVGGHLTHYWSPTLRSLFIGSYLSLTPGAQTRTTDWTLGGLSGATVWQIIGQLIWSPTKDMDVGFELTYGRLNQRLAATSVAKGGTGAPTAVPAAAGGFNPSSDSLIARLRVQRQF